MSENTDSLSRRREKKIPYVLGIIAATLAYSVSLLEPSIHGTKLWAIFSLSSFAVWISVLKLRNLVHGTGWIFPHTNTVLLWVVVVVVWLHLWFSH